MSVEEQHPFAERVRAALADFLTSARAGLAAIGPELEPVGESIERFCLDGGKRLRPAFCYWGWRGAGAADDDAVVAAAAALELLQAAALVHDDVMDASEHRRGRPSVHRQFAAHHRAAGWRGDPDRFGGGAAILIGDLCLVWADQMLYRCGLPAPALARGEVEYDVMRAELMAGQYLDLVEQFGGEATPERALRVARHKTARYTVEGPLRLGGALAGGPPELLAAYSAYGEPLGEAFQLRDDVLGVFGDPTQTGKPAGDDLREGKRTALVAFAYTATDEAGRALLRRRLGDPDLDEAGVAEVRALLERTGALAQVERLIVARARAARSALDAAPVEAAARDVLAGLVDAVTTRSG